MTDTQQQETTHSARSGYSAPVKPPTESPAIAQAKHEMDAIERHEKDIAGHRAARDQYVAKAAADGMKPPAISRALGMSTTNVRLAIERAR